MSYKVITIERHCRNCDHSKCDQTNGFNGLRCSLGHKVYATKGPYGQHVDTKGETCPDWDGSEIAHIEQVRGFTLYDESKEWPKTDKGWCNYFRELDKRFNSRSDLSPLHHDQRCPIHAPIGSIHRRQG